MGAKPGSVLVTGPTPSVAYAAKLRHWSAGLGPTCGFSPVASFSAQGAPEPVRSLRYPRGSPYVTLVVCVPVRRMIRNPLGSRGSGDALVRSRRGGHHRRKGRPLVATRHYGRTRACPSVHPPAGRLPASCRSCPSSGGGPTDQRDPATTSTLTSPRRSSLGVPATLPGCSGRTRTATVFGCRIIGIRRAVGMLI